MLGPDLVPRPQPGPAAGEQGGHDRPLPRPARAHGVDTADWWDRQLGLSLVGMAAVFAWEKAVGDQAELDWWERAALDGAGWL